jgi:adhesin transport system membrane fusion protein
VSESPLRALAANYPLPTWRPVARAIIVLLVVLFAWSCFAKLDEVSTASGEVVPEGKVKEIQHLEGGIVQDIFVHEGDTVKEGEKLMELALPVSATNKDELQVRIDGLNVALARMHAEANETKLVFPEDLVKRRPDLVEAERRSYDDRQQNLQATLAVLDEQQRQKTLEVQELQAKQRAVQQQLVTLQKKLDMSDSLLKEGLVSKMENNDLQNTVQDLQGQLEILKNSVPKAQSAADEAKHRAAEEKIKFVRASQADVTDAELNLARDRELMAQASDQQRRATITSPTDGIIKNLRQNTIGGVVRPGEEIMQVVPLHDRLQIEARLLPADRGYVAVGQPAEVKITAYDYTRYGGLKGTVLQVAPDTTVTSQGQAYYRVIVGTDKSSLGPDGSLPITPGMVAMVDIHTGQRSVLRYLATPVLKLKAEAFRER